MNTNIIDIIQSLEDACLFSRVGSAIADPTVQQISSWAEVVRWVEHPVVKWSLVEGQNLLTERLAADCMEEYRNWNKTVRDIKEIITPVLDRVVLPVLDDNDLPVSVYHVVSWEVLSACLECEYDSFYSLSLFRDLVKWFVKGHFPCGWIVSQPEEFPDQAITIIY